MYSKGLAHEAYVWYQQKANTSNRHTETPVFKHNPAINTGQDMMPPCLHLDSVHCHRKSHDSIGKYSVSHWAYLGSLLSITNIMRAYEANAWAWLFLPNSRTITMLQTLFLTPSKVPLHLFLLYRCYIKLAFWGISLWSSEILKCLDNDYWLIIDVSFSSAHQCSMSVCLSWYFLDHIDSVVGYLCFQAVLRPTLWFNLHRVACIV